jgi:hypothetical protein
MSKLNIIVSPRSAFEMLAAQEGAPTVDVSGEYRSLALTDGEKTTVIVEVDHPEIVKAFPVEPGTELYKEMMNEMES